MGLQLSVIVLLILDMELDNESMNYCSLESISLCPQTPKGGLRPAFIDFLFGFSCSKMSYRAESSNHVI